MLFRSDMPTRDELIATGRTDEQIAHEIGADHLIYQDLDALIADVRSVNPKVTSFEDSCFSGNYVTGDVTQAYLEGVEAQQRDGRKRTAFAASDSSVRTSSSRCLASSTMDFGRAVIRTGERLGGPPESSLIGAKAKVAAANAVLANATLAHGLDFDDTREEAIVDRKSTRLNSSH